MPDTAVTRIEQGSEEGPWGRGGRRRVLLGPAALVLAFAGTVPPILINSSAEIQVQTEAVPTRVVLIASSPATAGPRVTTSPPSRRHLRKQRRPGLRAVPVRPQPEADLPMTVQALVGPTSPVAGQEVVFQVTLTDPDDVALGSSVFRFGDSGTGGSSFAQCEKYGPWDPPARDPSRATDVQEARHTYTEAGTYTATFSFEAGPFECVDSVTGRGDRPYASGGVGTLTVVVT